MKVYAIREVANGWIVWECDSNYPNVVAVDDTVHVFERLTGLFNYLRAVMEDDKKYAAVPVLS